MNQQTTIYITQTDRERLGNLIEQVRDPREHSNLSYVNNLEDELEFAEIVASETIPTDVVTMRSEVRLKVLAPHTGKVYDPCCGSCS